MRLTASEDVICVAQGYPHIMTIHFAMPVRKKSQIFPGLRIMSVLRR